jgi:tRNA/tmRNA/rRNA uracil-C5-methylase (TrmA/RlmC/RlmD family)
VAGIELSESSVRFARDNADGERDHQRHLPRPATPRHFRRPRSAFVAADTAVIIDPPRKGCDASFLAQLFAFGPRTVVYVSCDPATQMRDLQAFRDRRLPARRRHSRSISFRRPGTWNAS